MAFLIDIDGTLMDTDLPQEGAARFISTLNGSGEKYLLMTNSIKSPGVQAERLRKAGMEVEEKRIINPIAAINAYLRARGIARARIIGTEDEIAQVDAAVVDSGNEIVILLDFEKGNKGYQDLQDVVDDMEKGIEVLAASSSPYYFKSGRKTIDTGAFVGLLEAVSGKRIVNFGKPSRAYFGIAASILAEEPAGISVIGDDWSTDIKGANEWGARSILVKSGKYREGDESREVPGLLVDSLLELPRAGRTTGRA